MSPASTGSFPPPPALKPGTGPADRKLVSADRAEVTPTHGVGGPMGEGIEVEEQSPHDGLEPAPAAPIDSSPRRSRLNSAAIIAYSSALALATAALLRGPLHGAGPLRDLLPQPAMFTVVGVLIIGLLNNGLDLLGISSYYQQVIKGLMIVAAVLIDKARHADAV